MNDNGLTLIEVIVSIAILGILAVTFMPILSNQYISIVGTGVKSKNTYLAVDDIEQKIAAGEYTEGKLLKIEFNNPKKIVDIKVNYIEAVLPNKSNVPKEGKEGEEENKIVVGIPEL